LGLALDKPKEGEKPVNVDGLEFLISEAMRDMAEGTSVDYIKTIMGSKFIVSYGPGC
jgi:Fe-S cluster assembly iron-binding protein IscA